MYYGDIYEIEKEIRKYDYELFEGEDVFATIPLEEEYINVKQYRKKAVLVKYDSGFVELAKLKTLKDFLSIYFEEFFELDKRKYVLKEFDFFNSYFIDNNSLKKCEKLDKKHLSVKKLQKIFKEKNNGKI